jgi:prepilin-type N-terminal cleavage/methylation domain-containing protein
MALSSLRSTKRGFTMIELLVTLAIIGILSALVMASLMSSRMKARDATRIADLTQIQLALELYFDVTQSYPTSTPTCVPACARPAADDTAVQLLEMKKFIQTTPIPPQGGVNPYYIYKGIIAIGGTSECAGATLVCKSYELGISLERDDNVVLNTDADQNVGIFYGLYPNCKINVAGDEKCYDVRP